MQKISKSRVIIVTIIILTIVVVLAGLINWKTTSEGERLAKQYCASCHAFPEPQLLTKHVWREYVMPQMAFRMGFPNFDIAAKISPQDYKIVRQVVPDKPLVTPEQFRLISEYYQANSPDELRITKALTNDLTLFRPQQISFEHPFFTLLAADPDSKRLIVGTQASRLFVLDSSLNVVDSIHFESPPSHIQFEGDSAVISLIGVLMPNDQSRGRLIRSARSDFSKNRTIIDSLARPVFFETRPNRYGYDDYIVCNFGNYTGNLLYHEHKDREYNVQLLSATPGARKTCVTDLDHDGRDEIVALFAQGDERISVFDRRDDNTFVESTLVRFPPVYGSNYFELADFNGDGFDDILFTNGDNGDFSIITKPYHAVRIFINDGKGKFNEKFVFPLPGASQAIAEDFDNDGDLDIAAIAFFADFERSPERGFVYLENNGNLNFTAQCTEAGSLGRWLLMTKWDFDEDGDADIFLGSSSYRGLGANADIFQHWADKATPLLLLENMSSSGSAEKR